MSRHDREHDAAGAVHAVKGRIGPALAAEHGAPPPRPRGATGSTTMGTTRSRRAGREGGSF